MLDIFLHLDQKSDNFITHEEMEPFFKLLRKDQASKQGDVENPPQNPVEEFISEIKAEDYVDKAKILIHLFT